MLATDRGVFDQSESRVPHLFLSMLFRSLLLEWTTNEPERGFDGVRYFSTSVGKYADHPEAAANSVFPVRTKAASGFCSRLREKFHLSPPVAWAILEHVDVPPVPRDSGDWTVDGSLVLTEVPV